MRRKMILPFLLLNAFVASCSDIAFTKEGYQKAVRSGLRKIPEARQFDEIFGKENVDHFISYHGSRSLGTEWNSEAFFEGRYILTMQVPVRMGYRFDDVKEVLSEPKFYLSEVRSIKYYGTQIGASFDAKGDHKFTAKDWEKIYKAKGDFSVIGIHLKKNRPVKDFEKYVQAIRGDRVKVSRTQRMRNSVHVP